MKELFELIEELNWGQVLGLGVASLFGGWGAGWVIYATYAIWSV